MPVSDKSKANLKPFVKGDKRINRKGRVTNFAQARKLALEVANEELATDAETITRLKALFRVMSTSRNPADRMGFLAYAVGKPKEEMEVSHNGKLEIGIKQVDYRNGVSIPATRSGDDSGESSQD